jgi:hypothetical protein
MRMKFWIPVGLFAVAATMGGSSPALAQPRTPPHDDRRPPPPDPRRDAHDDHRAPDGRPPIPIPTPDGRKDAHDDHPGYDANHPVQPGDPRDHFVQREEKEREHRKEAHKDPAAWAKSRQDRAVEERRDIATTWGGLTANAEAKAELAQHADRMSRLNRVIDLADDRNEPTVSARAKVLLQREIARNTRAMMAIKVKVGAR